MNLFSKFIGEPVPTYHARELQEKLQSDHPPFLVDVRQRNTTWAIFQVPD
jgi:hypothetical protein